MSYKNVTVVGEEITDSEWPEVEEMAKEIESCGVQIVKILNYKEGSIKFIAKLNGDSLQNTRTKLEEKNWRVGAPYYSRSQIIGFKISRNKEGKDVNVWGA